MNDALKEKWDEAEKTGQPIPVGANVVCDGCNKDFTGSTESGGFVFGSNGYGPCCAAAFMKGVERYNEQSYIKATCPPGVSFADFIRAYRGPDAAIQITSSR